MTKPIPPLYTPTLVDTPTKTHLVEVLAAYGSAGIMQGTLDDVFLALLTKQYPLQDVLPYLYDGPVPAEWYSRPRRFDHRGLCLWFWNSYIRVFTEMPRPVRPRLPDGTQPFVGQAPDDQLLFHLTQLPFLAAIHTWLAVVEEWLQICNVDWYWPYVAKYPNQLAMWKPGDEVSIPIYLASLKATDYW
jgi:hypothetical protein